MTIPSKKEALQVSFLLVLNILFLQECLFPQTNSGKILKGDQCSDGLNLPVDRPEVLHLAGILLGFTGLDGMVKTILVSG
jgi:hypothetical protein